MPESSNQHSNIPEKPNIKAAFLILVFGVGAIGAFTANAIWWAMMK